MDVYIRNLQFWKIIIWTICVSPIIIQGFDFPFGPPQPKSLEGPNCKSGDIRNSVDNFEKLKDCEIIEGNLQILLIDKAEPEEYKDLHFPKLREITEFLVLFRVSNLVSLSHIFPNLAVIRGDKLFHNYALVVYEMLELQEIGLPSLVNITRGGVRIEKNPNLCYLNTIDWSLILHEGVDSNFIVDNKDQEDCLNFCPEDVLGSRMCRRHGASQELCWTSDFCQKVCPVQCPAACRDDGQTCCHEQCIGGCNGTTASHCTVCRNLVLNNTCIDECPPGTYKYRRRCIQPQECPDEWILFNGVCDEQCPIGFTQNTTNPKECQPCDGPCPKVCSSSEINSVAAASELKGCTKLLGSLFLSIHGASESNIMMELEENLGFLEEITGSLVVTKAASLVSLNFLKRLRIIRGDRLKNDKYAVYVMDNRNLQHLFHWGKHPNITIGRGKLFFHFNPKLCMTEIRKLNEYIGGNTTFGHGDVNPSTNGDQVACSTDRLVVNINAKSTFVHLIWNTADVELGDQRNLLGFIVQWKETLEKNVMEFDGEDVCGASTWESKFVDPPKPDEFDQPQRDFVIGLQPYTLYAFLVRSYTISDTNYGAKSEIMYIRTLESIPSAPENLNVYSNSPTNLILSWSPPENPNGIITHYIARWQRQALDKQQFYSRDFCREKPPTLKKSGRKEEQDIIEDENNVTVTAIPGCCGCPKDPEELKREQEQARQQREFENELHNNVYTRRPGTRRRRDISFPDNSDRTRRRRDVSFPDNSDGIRRRRDVSSPDSSDGTGRNNFDNKTLILVPLLNNTTLPPPVTPTPTEKVKIPVIERRINVSRPDQVMFMTLDDLDHFEEYRFELIACNNEGCGGEKQKSVIFGRTVPKAESDEIKNVNISMDQAPDSNKHNVKLTWTEPPNPNGIVIIYEIEYAKIEDAKESDTTTTPITDSEDTIDTIDNAMSPIETVECINIHEYRRYSGYELSNMAPGNYTARIRAITLAGNGPQTETRIFQVPDIRVAPPPTPSTKFGQYVTIFVVVGLLVFTLFVFFFCLVRWQFRKDHMPDGVLYASVNPEYMSTNDMYVADEWEFPRDHLEIIQELGKGSFGMVYEGLAKGILPEEPITKVAVKSVQANASIRDRIEFLNEASVMKSINAHHVVRLMGVVSKGQPTYVIMEFMAQGDLKNWLRARRPENQAEVPLSERKQPPTYEEIINMSAEIADGMAHLASHKFVHRDLSARNCLVSEEGTCKVADFGLARDIYQSDYYRKERGGMLPIRWMGPESVKDGVFQCSSDVWSYGILLWEIATLGELPYQGYSNEEAGEYIKSGKILPKREGTPDILHDLMLQCWQYNDKMRPTFFDILHTLENTGILYPNFTDVSFYHGAGRQPDHHEMPPEDQAAMFNEEEDEDEGEMDKLSNASGGTNFDDSRTPLRKDAHGAMNGYVSMPVNGVANGTASNGPVCKVTEC